MHQCVQVYLYGSVESKLCLTKNNDLDLTLVLGAPGQPQQEPTAPSEVVTELGAALEEKGMQVCGPFCTLPDKNMPVVLTVVYFMQPVFTVQSLLALIEQASATC